MATTCGRPRPARRRTAATNDDDNPMIERVGGEDVVDGNAVTGLRRELDLPPSKSSDQVHCIHSLLRPATDSYEEPSEVV